MDQINTEFWTMIIELAGAVGTILSVLIAIYTYRHTQTTTALLEVKKGLWVIPTICNEINELLSERVFSALGDSIATEFRKLHEDGQSLDDYSNFLLDDDRSHNCKAQAIYAGLKNCDEVTKIENLIKEYEEIQRTVSIYFPCIGMALDSLFFYIRKGAKRTISPAIFNRSVLPTLDDDRENSVFIKAITLAKATNSIELYFRELSNYFSQVSEGSLRQTAHGQRTVDLSINMISLTCSIMGELEIRRLHRIKRIEKRLLKKNADIDEEHAVEDAMVVLKKYKKYYKEDHWEKTIECKARIIENMKQ